MDVNPYAPPSPVLTTESPAAPRLWNPDAAGVWSVFLTPIFGSTLILKNWQAVGEQPRVKAGRMWLAASILVVIISGNVYWLNLLYLIAWYFAWQKKQARYVNERWGKDYPRKSWVAPVLIALGVATLAAAVVRML